MFTMELLNNSEIKLIAEKCGFSKVSGWYTEELADKIVGYLGDHLKLIMEVESNGCKLMLNLFVKCMPRFDKWKSEYLKETGFFKKEHIMLSTLFKEFNSDEGSRKWRPKLLFIKEDIFVFENVSSLGYEMPHHQDTMTYEELKASVKTLARFHAQSYIYEERKSIELSRPYRIWEQYGDYLQEPNEGQDWRDTGRNAVIDYLKVFSKYKSTQHFNRCIEKIIPKLFDSALDLMKPSTKYRNVVVHRDLWTNNIFLKKQNSEIHALIVDFQTVIYASPMLDLSSLIYFNTTRNDRDNWTYKLIDVYYTLLSEELQAVDVDIEHIFDRATLRQAYDKSILFGLTQAAIITPIVAMSREKREEIFNDPISSRRANVVTRSKEFIDIANEDYKYQTRITELLDEILEIYVFPKETGINAKKMSGLVFEHNSPVNHITEEDIKLILASYNSANEDINIEHYSVHYASDKMLGFLAEYWKVKVHLLTRKVLYFFIKSISRSNAAKAKMVKEMRLFDKEAFFYSEIKEKLEVPGLRPWAAKLITVLDGAMVFEDLNAIHFKLRNKFDRFDMAHTLEALKALARFHASSIIFEEKKSKETQCRYIINDEYEQSLDRGGYHMSSDWFLQCMAGALEAMKSFSKYDEIKINLIQSRWRDVWAAGLNLSDFSPKYRNVICHRDLWNNNIMFHYDKLEHKPDDCVLVDFQAIRYQPPAGDVMLLLCCNLDPKFREENTETFLNFYYAELEEILSNHNVEIDDILTKKDFYTSAEEQRQWSLIVCACLMPQFWLDDDLTKNIFTDNAKFDDILTKNKGLFIKDMMESNSDYKQKVLEIFEELADRYCLNAK